MAEKTKTKKKIAIVYPSGQLPIIPSLVGMIELLSENGYELDLFVCKNSGFPYLDVKLKNFNKYILGSDEEIGSVKWKLRYVFFWLPKLLMKCKLKQYKCIIGVDPLGLVLAYLPSIFLKTPLVYFSLELLIYRELSSRVLKLLKKVERKANRSAALTIIQDVDRAKIIIQENGIPEEKIAFLPNAPTGDANIKKSNYLRNSLRISNERKIILHSGAIHPGQMSLVLAEEAKSWDSNVVMVFHCRNILKTKYENIFKKNVDEKKVFLTDRPVNFQLYSELISSADLGIALYQPFGAELNLVCMGLSSGKIASYLQRGLPIVVSSFPTLKKLVEEYECGIAVESVKDVKNAIGKIFVAYEIYSANAIRCFNEKFHFQTHFKKVLDRIREVAHYHY